MYCGIAAYEHTIGRVENMLSIEQARIRYRCNLYRVSCELDCDDYIKPEKETV